MKEKFFDFLSIFIIVFIISLIFMLGLIIAITPLLIACFCEIEWAGGLFFVSFPFGVAVSYPLIDSFLNN